MPGDPASAAHATCAITCVHSTSPAMALRTKNEIQSSLQGLAAEAVAVSPREVGTKLMTYLASLLRSEEELEPEAQQYVDTLVNNVLKASEQILELTPDSEQKRQMLRHLARARGEHFTVDGILEGLANESVIDIPPVVAIRDVFKGLIQAILDVLFDATRESQSGAAQLGFTTLLYWSIDELCVGFYLAQRGYTTQGYAHVRTVFEFLDLVELFRLQPHWADFWASEPQKKAWKELSPRAVREKLGKATHDPIYKMLSEVSTHATFQAIQTRMHKTQPRGSDSDLGVQLWIGGTQRMEQIVMSNGFVTLAAMSVLMRAMSVFASRLHEEDATALLQTQTKALGAYLENHFEPWARQNGLDTTELLRIAHSIPNLDVFKQH